MLISSAPVMSKAFVLQRVIVCRDKSQPEGHPQGQPPLLAGRHSLFPQVGIAEDGKSTGSALRSQQINTENTNRKKHRVGLFPWGSGGEISREIGFRFCTIPHSIEFNYFIVKILEDKCPLSLFRHCLSGVITYFQIVLMRHCVAGSVQSMIWNESSLCKVLSLSVILLSSFYAKN